MCNQEYGKPIRILYTGLNYFNASIGERLFALTFCDHCTLFYEGAIIFYREGGGQFFLVPPPLPPEKNFGPPLWPREKILKVKEHPRHTTNGKGSD